MTSAVRIRSTISFALLALFVGACSKDKEAPEAKPTRPQVTTSPKEEPLTAPPVSAEGKSAVEIAKAGAKNLGKTLKGRLVKAMSSEGIGAALDVCADEAQILSAQAQAPGLKVGRASLRLRNKKNSDAPQWVQDWLTEQGEKKAAGVDGVEWEKEGKAGVLIPIVVQGACLGCHGAEESLAEEIKAKLAKHYPEDSARNYSIGDLRGALWAEYSPGNSE